MSIPNQLSSIRCTVPKEEIFTTYWLVLDHQVRIYKHELVVVFFVCFVCFFVLFCFVLDSYLEVDSKFQQTFKTVGSLGICPQLSLPLPGSLRFNLGQLRIFLLLLHNYWFLLSPVELMEKTISVQNVDIFQREFWQRLITGQSEFSRSRSWGPSVAKVQPQNEPIVLGVPLFPTSSCPQCTRTRLLSTSHVATVTQKPRAYFQLCSLKFN